jgi:RNA polymerase sigma factor (sigma-70 family)
MMTSDMLVRIPNDAELVADSLAGNRDAFGQIVSRYQSMICALAYSATGNLGQSEDLAQETFITAWKHLRHLKEQSKLRAWLYGIARNRVNNWLRREGHEALRTAEPLELADEALSAEPLPREQAISNEEASILWRALEGIDHTYREPLILFYRENQSVEAVAEALDLSEDAVKQRLSRGRKLLAEEMTGFVEGTLKRTKPDNAFTANVLAALPVTFTGSAKMAALGAAAAKGSLAAKAVAGGSLLGTILGPLMGLLGPWLQYRVLLNLTPQEEQRGAVRRYFRQLMAMIVVLAVLLVGLTVLGVKFFHSHPLVFAYALTSLVTGYIALSIRMGIRANALFRKIRVEQNTSSAIATSLAWEYRSKMELLGLPLVHIRFNPAGGEKRNVVKAWIAGGDFAFGVLFACGAMAVAPFAIGGIGIGLIAWAGLAVGVCPLGGFAIGVWAFGGFALGWQAFGGIALGLDAAMGGIAIARDIALGGMAHAAQANGESVKQFINNNGFFQAAIFLSRYIGWLNLLWVLPFYGLWKAMRNHRRVQP